MRDSRCERGNAVKLPHDAISKGRRTGNARLVSRISCLVFPLLLAGCRSTPPPKPLDQLTPQEAQGHEIFQARCARCHYDREHGSLHGPSLLGLYKRTYLPSGAPANDDRVGAVIVNGRNMMPPTQGLDQGSPDFNALIAYLHTL